MSEFKKYFTARSHVFMRPYEPGEEVRWVDKVHVSPRDGATGSPKLGDYIAFSQEKPEDHYLVSAENFKSYEATGEGEVVTQTEAEDTQAPMVRDPLKNAEAEEEAAQNGEASTKTVLTSKPEEASEQASESTEEASEETQEPEGDKPEEPKAEEPKADPKPVETPKPADSPKLQSPAAPKAKEAPKFPTKVK